MYVEFTPVDEAARDVLLLICHFDPESSIFEDEFQIEIPDQTLRTFIIVKDIVSYLESRV